MIAYCIRSTFGPKFGENGAEKTYFLLGGKVSASCSFSCFHEQVGWR